ncbi:hypothetical protein BDZ85DRAFT_56634 [Elsinoe ampelina]|uniref:Uncharacterized protein n=1 Tax=Elsinoe ampelina TaxID=302913 RepID=A0A6A6GMM7_9PEZI|nr:hypothetical protein BDZ85DRAFT_56634 [Elsinoe ampelina]
MTLMESTATVFIVHVTLDGETLNFQRERSYRVVDLVDKAKVAEELTNETVEQYIVRETLDEYDDDMRVIGYDTSAAHVAVNIITWAKLKNALEEQYDAKYLEATEEIPDVCLFVMDKSLVRLVPKEYRADGCAIREGATVQVRRGRRRTAE